MNTPSDFTADPAKNARNVAMRGIDLVEGARAFNFVTAAIATDNRMDCGEIRKVATGFVARRLHVLVFTMRGTTCPIISLRKANEREIRRYANSVSTH